MPKRMFLLITGALAAGLVGIVMIAGQVETSPQTYLHLSVRAAPEITQLPRDEHDLIAEMIKAQLVAGAEVNSRSKNWQPAQLPSEANLSQLRGLG